MGRKELFPVKAVIASCIIQGSRDGGEANLSAERRERERLTHLALELRMSSF